MTILQFSDLVTKKSLLLASKS